jgi:prolyl oligopeptidase
VAFDASAPAAGYREVVPEAPNAISTWSGVAPMGAVVAGGRLLVTYIEDGRTVPRLFTLEGTPLGDIALPYEGSIWSGWVGTEADDTVFYSLSGLADPGTVYALDVRSGESRVFRAPDLPYRIDEIRTDFVRIPARDGAEIPAFVVRRAGTALDGHAPLVLYGYGFAGWNAAPYFYPLMASLVQRGAVWVVAAVRGDGGYGTDWHLAGRRRAKPTAIADYVDVSRWLVEQGFTSADRLIANGSSAGGALVAAAVVANPDLYRAMILDYPLVDVLRYDRFGNASGWVPEYGSASDPEDFAVLRGYAPLQRIAAGECYPATFLAPGENDGRTPPFHAYKLAAALERANGCQTPVLLRVSWGAGHASGADLERSLDNWADQATFLDAVLPEGSLR